MRILLIGASGMLGSDLLPVLRERGHEVLAPSSSEFDVTDPSSVARIPAGEFGRLDWCVNCSAYTAVDKAETERREATELNAMGPGYLAKASASEGSRLIHISTDFVFSGEATAPYDEEAPTKPLGTYGKTKRDGETAVEEAHSNAIILRTSWLYGPNGNSFPKTMIKAWESGRDLKVVADQVGSPTYTADLARTIADVIERDPFPGVYHASGPDAMTWHEFARRAIQAWKRKTGSERQVSIAPISTSDWPTPAKRPAYSVLSNAKLHAAGIAPMRPVDVALADFVERLTI